MKVAKSVVIPSADRVDESGLVELTHHLRQVLLRFPISLAPAFVINDLLL
jgi:hypothetical protein